MTEKREVRLSQGTIRYRELGSGPPLVFVHGYLVDGRLWDRTAEDLAAAGFRCLVPDWPLGAHRLPMDPATDLTPPGIVAIISEFIAELELDDVTIVANDSGGALSQILVTTRPERIGRLALTNCDTHENFPPGIFKLLPPLAKVPGLTPLMTLPFRVGFVGRIAFRPFATEPISRDLIAEWLYPSSHDSAIRRDLRKVTMGMDKRYTVAAAAALRGSSLPVLFVWGTKSGLFPLRNAERLADEIGAAAEVSPVEGGKTFLPIDQPAAVADRISQFARSS